MEQGLALPRTDGARLGKQVLQMGRTRPMLLVSAAILLLLALSAALAPLLSSWDPIATSIAQRLSPPSALHPFGTDELGRDIFSRVLYGGRASLYVGLASVALGTIAGAVLGALSAYAGGKVDLYLQRLMDVFLAFPALILGLAILTVLGGHINNVVLAVALPFVPRTNRVVRSSVLSIKTFLYIEAAQATGCNMTRILRVHILPNALAPYLVIATSLLGAAILVESSLSFLGLGVPPPAPSWGRGLSEAMPYMRGAPWAAIFPGLFISLAVYAVNILGDILRDTLDPRLRGRQPSP
ncbi:MAG: ABC transporter permease [Chloroflexi bacterium]|nr:ABC transporter permease [Chloroflexota bacterium]